MSDDQTAPPSPNTPDRPRRRNLRVAERMKLIEDYKKGITDRFYYVSPHPKKPGEYVIRKRRTPLTYDVPVGEVASSPSPTQSPSPSPSPTQSPSPSPSPTPPYGGSASLPSTMLQQSLAKPTAPLAGLSPGPSVEFFSMQSAMNLNLQRELDALHEKYNKLDAKMRKERASRKATKASSPPQQPETPSQSSTSAGNGPATSKVPCDDEPHHVSDGRSPVSVRFAGVSEGADDGEYEYEYVDEPSPSPSSSPPPPAPVASPWTPYIRRRHIDIRDF